MGSAGCLMQTRHVWAQMCESVEECDQAPADWPATASVEKGAGEVPARQGGLDLRGQCHVCPRPWVRHRVPTVFLHCRPNHGIGPGPSTGELAGNVRLGQHYCLGAACP